MSYSQRYDYLRSMGLNIDQIVNSEEAKEQASLGASGRPSQAIAGELSQTNDEQLVVGTRMGDKDSMIARMRKIREASQTPE